ETVREFALERWVLPMLGRSEHVRGLRYTCGDHARNARDGRRVLFVRLPARGLSRRARDYLARGERDELPARFKCRIRSPWWAVPSVWRAPVALLKRCQAHPRLVLNTAGAFSTDTAYRLVPRRGVSPEGLVASFAGTLPFLL